MSAGSGLVIWVTGRPSSGKSTFAANLVARLSSSPSRPSCVLDGDAVRALLSPKPGYDATSRAAFYETLASLAAYLARQGLVVVVPATAHLRAFRERARALAPRYLEVFVDVTQAECVARDAKGLYALARSGEVSSLPGADTPYEPPLAPDFHARGGADLEALEKVLAATTTTKD